MLGACVLYVEQRNHLQYAYPRNNSPIPIGGYGFPAISFQTNSSAIVNAMESQSKRSAQSSFPGRSRSNPGQAELGLKVPLDSLYLFMTRLSTGRLLPFLISQIQLNEQNLCLLQTQEDTEVA